MLKHLGQRIRKLRKEKQLTLVEIAEKTGIAQATLSRIETGTMIGTVESHGKIAEAIGIGLAELYADIDERYDTIHQKKQSDAAQVTHHSQSVQIELLTAESSKKKITPLLITLQHNGHTAMETLDRGIEKFFFIIEGEVTAKVGDKVYPLKHSETLYFDASLPHQVTNEKNKTAKILVAVSPSRF